jgi:hypothetical protein
MQRHGIVPCPMRLPLTHHFYPSRVRPTTHCHDHGGLAPVTYCICLPLSRRRFETPETLSLSLSPGLSNLSRSFHPPYFPLEDPSPSLSLVQLQRYLPAFGLNLRAREASLCFPSPSIRSYLVASWSCSVDSLESKWASVRFAPVFTSSSNLKDYPQPLILSLIGRYGVVLDAGSSVRRF